MDLLSYVNSIQITHRNNTETQDITLTLLSPVGFVTFPIKAVRRYEATTADYAGGDRSSY